MPLARHVATVAGATLLSRLLGFLRDVGIAAALGAGGLSDAFFAALQIPNLFRRLLAEGALNSAFVPMWMRVRDDKGSGSARHFAEEVFGSMLLGLGIVALLCVIFAPVVVHLLAPGFGPAGIRFPLAAEFVALSAPYVAIAGMVAVAASVLNAENRVAAAAFGLVIFNFVLVAAVAAVLGLGIASTPEAGRYLSIAIVVAGFAQLLLVGSALLGLEAPPLRPRLASSPQARRFFAQVGPGVIAGGIPQLKLMAGTMVASASPAAVSWLYYANRLYELPLGVVSIAISAVMVPAIAAGVRAQQRDIVAAAQSRALEIALGLALPAAIAFGVLAEQIAAGLFERGAFGPRDTAAVASALAAICAGLPGHILEKVFGAVSFAHEDTRTPMMAALAGLTTAVVGALVLFPIEGHAGIAAAIAMSGWVGATIMGLVLWRRRWIALEPGSLWRLVRIALAAIAMGLVIAGARNVFAPLSGHSALARAAVLAFLVALGLAAYAVLLQILGVTRLRELVAALRQRL